MVSVFVCSKDIDLKQDFVGDTLQLRSGYIYKNPASKLQHMESLKSTIEE